jgi:hypothetical protein
MNNSEPRLATAKAFPPGYRKLPALLTLLLAVVLLGGWRDFGETINPKYVARIKDGVTTKHEILLLFGDPQNVDRSPEAVIFTYRSYADAPPPVSSKLYHEANPQSSTPFVIDDQKNVKLKTPHKGGKILKGTLTVRFTPDGQKVVGHEYKEVQGTGK